jgi:RNA polymerase sigma-70 factor, ECF subfamily
VQDEQKVVERAQKGDSSAFAQIYEEYFDRIYRYIAVRIFDRTEAEDLTEQVFLKSLESIKSFKWKGSPFSSWLFRIAHNQVVDWQRKMSKRQNLPLDDAILGGGVDTASAAELNLTMDELRVALSKLTELQRQVIILRFASGLSIAESAKIMGKSDGAVKAMQHSAVVALRKAMSGGGVKMERIEEALNDCLERMASGESIESCLVSYPDLADDLQPLLVTARGVVGTTSSVQPRADFKAAARYRFYSALANKDKQVTKSKDVPRKWGLRWATVAIAVLVIFVIGGGTGIASAGSNPGDALYGVKTFVERVQMGLTVGNTRKANLQLKFAERRSEEMQVLVTRGNLEDANNIGLRLANHIENAKKAAPALLENGVMVDRLEKLANRQVALLEAIYDKAPVASQPAIDTLIGSINDAYDTAIEDISDVPSLPDVQVVLDSTPIVSGNTLTGSITVTNSGDVDARINGVKYSLAFQGGRDNNIWKRLRLTPADTDTLGGLAKGVIIPAQDSTSFDYSVTFVRPAGGTDSLRGVISIKLAGRGLWYYDIAQFDTPTLQ